MPAKHFTNIYATHPAPVIVCKNQADYPICYTNASAKMILDPRLTTVSLTEEKGPDYLGELLRFSIKEEYDSMVHALRNLGAVNEMRCSIYTFENTPMVISVTAHVATYADQSFVVVYFAPIRDAMDDLVHEMNETTSTMYRIAQGTEEVDELIGRLLAFVGAKVHVSRVYIFEEESATCTRNTYEWCNEGVEPAIQDLQHLDKEDYNYDVIVNGGMYITDDVSTLPENDREILEMQGIKALAILPLIHIHTPLGYIGFDDCDSCRHWSSAEISLLQSMTNIIISLILRRDAENKAKRALAILQTTSDNIDSIIYVNDMETNEVIFTNKVLERSLNVAQENLLGHPCWKVLQKDMDGPCGFCPTARLKEAMARGEEPTCVWEFQNTKTGKWYLVRDSIIKWIDGKDVHIETATDITEQKMHQKQLEYYASTDIMTGTFNREWGYKAMEHIMADKRSSNEPVSLVFIDLDGLKKVNDSMGHDAGDQMILKTIDIIKSNIRLSDIVCRWGGDEFIVLLHCDTKTAKRIMEKIQKRMEEVNSSGALPFPLSFSYGITNLHAKSHSTVDSVISYADKQMYRNKMKKRGEVAPSC